MNMHYCRFQNTLDDLEECYENWKEEGLSDMEQKARTRLLRLCERIVADYGRQLYGPVGDKRRWE